MKNLESMERGTPEFQALTKEQQESRRNLLVLVLNSVISNPSSLGLTEQETVRFVSDFLEFHLTGRIERFPETLPTRKKNTDEFGFVDYSYILLYNFAL